jgi:hypothetical protein
MIIAIDYDETYTRDMKMFAEIIRIMKQYGHEPIVVTMRYNDEENKSLNSLRSIIGGGIPVYYTGRRAKKPFMEALNIRPDIWIDDTPEWILKDAAVFDPKF